MKHKRDLKLLLHPYFIVNMLLSALFFISKTVPLFCTWMYDDCYINLQEYEMLIFLGSFVALRNKRQFSIPDYLAHFYMFAKIVSLLMFWKQNVVYAILYGVLWLVQACFLQQPVYNGPDKVLYLRDTTFEQEVIRGNPKVTWLVAFYTVWSPACTKLQPIFAELSEEFGTDLMKFGKIDVIRYPDVGVKHNIDTSSWSKQLPTLILFRQGHELTRRPAIINTPKKTVQKFTFTWDNMINAFSLNEIYTNQKQTSSAANQCGSAGSTDKDKKNL
ncbi:unnamed protein product [Schistosoma bovis]|uniref:Thioredoxin domain-containing protein n=1 Tax=Schistosoma bovis TaxID=6184 RepID=A0A430Q9T5_SCHBO|nr:uncharacterized protein DC041_0007021 [Schistosoma bovis]CAH8498792.1 unnamed protein product [Schistosoma intercalatum]CAH8499848.1 unnamed protein product [Schistosoma intercalatum]CAH8509763.1 unnamed protein product [Schistosoma bovis]